MIKSKTTISMLLVITLLSLGGLFWQNGNALATGEVVDNSLIKSSIASSHFIKKDQYNQRHDLRPSHQTVLSITIFIPNIVKEPIPGLPDVQIVGVVYDPEEGSDLEGERVVIQNFETVPINLMGWQLHDKAETTYTFPNYTLQPQASVTLWVKNGTDDIENLYWGLSRPIWNNDGDIATLKNIDGMVIDTFTYPTTTPEPTNTPIHTSEPTNTIEPTATIDPNAPDVKIVHVEYNPDNEETGEYVEIKNNESITVDLTGWTLSDAVSTTFTFPKFTLESQALVKIWVFTGTNDAKNLYWGRNANVWNNNGDTATLKGADGTTVDIYTYPTTPEPTETPITTPEPTNTPTATIDPSAPDIKIIHIEYDPDNEETGEYVEIKNMSSNEIDMFEWVLSDKANNSFTFPQFTLQSQTIVKVWVFTGTNDTENLYWGRNANVWNNNGDTATLKDADGTTIDIYTYPTTTPEPINTPQPTNTPTATTNPNTPNIEIIRIEYDPDNEETGEYVEIKNVSSNEIDMFEWVLSDKANNSFTFPQFTLQSQAIVKVWVFTGTNDTENLYWGRNANVWNNNGDTATLKDANGAIIDIYTYPTTTPEPTSTLTNSPTITPTLDPKAPNVKITHIEYNPDGSDGEGEYVDIQNFETSIISLTNWHLHDESGATFTFPELSLDPQGTVRIWVRDGTNDTANLYWGNSFAVWNNTGDTATLTDANDTIVDVCSYDGGGTNITCYTP